VAITQLTRTRGKRKKHQIKKCNRKFQKKFEP